MDKGRRQLCLPTTPTPTPHDCQVPHTPPWRQSLTNCFLYFWFKKQLLPCTEQDCWYLPSNYQQQLTLPAPRLTLSVAEVPSVRKAFLTSHTQKKSKQSRFVPTDSAVAEGAVSGLDGINIVFLSPLPAPQQSLFLCSCLGQQNWYRVKALTFL